jgi:hypothetical protein
MWLKDQVLDVVVNNMNLLLKRWVKNSVVRDNFFHA